MNSGPSPSHDRGRQSGHAAFRWYARAAAALICLAAACASQDDVPPLEQRAQALNRTIMCPVCPGESLDQSQHVLASQMRAVVDEKLAEGRSDESIREFFVERYGPSVLMEPPGRGATALVWIVPPLGAVAAAAGLFLVLRSMRRAGPAAPNRSPANPLSDRERESYFRRIESAMADPGRDERG